MQNDRKALKLAYVAMGAALLCLCSWISVPVAVPFTLQTFGVFLLLLTLGGKMGTAAIGTFLLLGAAGLPVFSGFQGGIGALLGPTGGYLWGFLLTGLLYSLAEKKMADHRAVRVLSLVCGLLLCYAFGTLWFKICYAKRGNAYSWGAVLSLCVLPYLIPDGLKLWLALYLSRHLRKALKH